MPQSNEGVLLVIGALFLLLGLLGGGFEVAAFKVPPVGKYTRAIALALGALVFGVGLFRLLFSPAPIPIPIAAVTLVPTAPPTAPPTLTPIPPTLTSEPSPTILPTPTSTIPPPTPTPTNPPPTVISPTLAVNTGLPITGKFDDIHVEYDVTRFERKGMLIHIKFVVTGLVGVQCKAVAYFYERTGEALKDTDGTFTTVDGSVSASDVFTPGYESTVYDDFQVFIPYDELGVGEGTHNLKFNVLLFDLRDTSKALAVSPDVNFVYTK